MQRKRIVLLAILLTAGLAPVTVEAQHTLRNKPRPPLGNNPNPVIWGGHSAKPAPQQPPPKAPKHSPRDGSHHREGHFHHRSYNCYPWIGGISRWGPYYTYRYYDSYLYPPVYYYPYAEDLYGPQAMQRFLGEGNQAPFEQQAIPEINVDAPAPNKVLDRATNAQANALAWRFIGFGDAQFAEGKYIEANNRYRKASHSAPQLADAWFRQGFALSAMGRHAQAVGAVKRGLKINPDWAQSEFELREFFGADELVKNALLETLADELKTHPNDANRLFMSGVYLHFDGQTQRAQEVFKRALQVAGDDSEHIRTFLAK